MLRRVITVLLALCLLWGCAPAFISVAKAEGVPDISELVDSIPEVADPMGTEYYFYNQLSDLEKAFYWLISEAAWDAPNVTVSGVADYGSDELNTMAQRALSALIADAPEYHMLWERYGSGAKSAEGIFVFSLQQYPISTEYQIEKARFRIRQIVETVGKEGDTYSRTRDLLELMYLEMDYDNYTIMLDGTYTLAGTLYNDCALGCLLRDYAVCAGFADTFKILCDELEIPCITIGNAGHAWNYVRMDDGLWYSVDTSIDWPFEWGGNLEGRFSSFYSENGNYFLSDPYLGTPGDFTFPTLADYEYIYEGVYSQSFHTSENQFTEPEAQFLYQVNGDGASCTITGFEGQQYGDFVIPSSIDGYAVTAIAEGAFWGRKDLGGNLVIADTVTHIGNGAFMRCTGFTGTLQLSAALESLGNCAFLECSGLSGDLFLPNSLQSIGTHAFRYCTGLSGTVTLPDTLEVNATLLMDTALSEIEVHAANERYSVHDGILYTKDMVTLIVCPPGKVGNVNIPEGVEVIAANAFYQCAGVTGDLVLPNGLKTISSEAFRESGFDGHLIIPGSVESIGYMAFAFAKLTGDLIIPDAVTSVDGYAFLGAAFDGKLTLSNSLTTIAAGAFACPNLSGDLIIPDSVKRIEDSAFSGCLFGGELYLPDSLEYIGAMALAGSSSNYDTTHFSNALDLSSSDVVLEKDAFMWTSFPDFMCNCSAPWIEGEQIEATCSQDGYARTSCSVCAGTRSEILYAKGHDYTSVVTAPTCTEQGYTTHTCACGDSYVDSYVEATGHDYVVGICTVCGYTAILLGDVNGDGEIDILDANLIVTYYNEIADLTEEQLRAADVNGDGDVDIMDANMIVAYYNEVIDAFPDRTE